MMLGRLIVVVAMATGLFAQSQEPSQAVAGDPGMSPIRVESDEVIVPVTVTDSQGKFVADLDEDDFTIYDQGIPQEITYFSRERNQPIVIGFLIEQSNSMRLHWKRYQQAAEDLVFALMPEDRPFSAYLISYHTQAELVVNTTNDPAPIVDAIREMKPGGGSALYDAIYMACTSRELVKGEPIEPRRVIVIIGDGHDNASSSRTLDQVVELAQRNLVTIYAVSTVSFEQTLAEESNLIRLAAETGGRVEYPLDDVYDDTIAQLSKSQDAGNYALVVGTGDYGAHITSSVFESIAALMGEITTQYILRYRPSAIDEPRIFRQIRVDVGLPGVYIRYRRGYYPYAP